MNNIFRARVSSVKDVDTSSDREGRKQIYVSPIGYGAGVYKEYKAYPPNVIPNSKLGSGLFSYPKEGQECIVLIDDSSAYCQILSYTMFPGEDMFGKYIESNMPDPGGVVLKIGGYNNSIISLNEGGKINIDANPRCNINLNGNNKSINMSSMTMRIDYAGGSIVNNYNKEYYDTNISEVTSNVICYKKTYEEPAFSDWEQLPCDKAMEIMPYVDYVDKCVIRAGYVPNLYNPLLVNKHVFQLDTRQSTGDNKKLKDTITELRIGYQEDGTMMEWKAKRITDNNNIAHVRYGEIESGEILRLHLLQGKKLITDLYYDNLFAEKGYDLNVPDDADSQYVIQFGELSDGSIYNVHYHNGAMSYYDKIGGSNIYYNKYNKGDNELINIYNTEQYKITINKPDISNVILIDDDNINISRNINNKVYNELRLHNDDILISRSTNDGEIEELLFSDKEVCLSFITENNTDAITIEEDNIGIINRTGAYVVVSGTNVDIDSVSHIGVNPDEVNITLGNSYITATEDNIKLSVGSPGTYVEITDGNITLSLGDINKIVFDNSGLTINGKSFVLDTFLDWLSSNSSNIGIGNMGAPVPMFPTALTNFQIKNSVPFSPQIIGFKTI